MRFEDFEEAARQVYDAIPPAFKEGVEGLVVSRQCVPHPELAGVFTLGECMTEEYVSDWGGPDTTRSVVALYWGSFEKLAAGDPEFDWEGELWETLTHELRHHLESLAREDSLEGVDYAADETFKRDEGLDFDPWYYQHGEAISQGVYKVEDNHYMEQGWHAAAFDAAEHLDFSWEGAHYRAPRPDELGDVHFVWMHGVVEPPQTLELVLVRRRGWWADAKRLVGMYRPVVRESEADAVRLPGGAG